MQKSQPILAGLIYEFKRGCVSAYSSDPKQYRYCTPSFDWLEQTSVGDVLICDRNGVIDPDNTYGVPVPRSSIGQMIGRNPTHEK